MTLMKWGVLLEGKWFSVDYQTEIDTFSNQGFPGKKLEKPLKDSKAMSHKIGRVKQWIEKRWETKQQEDKGFK